MFLRLKPAVGSELLQLDYVLLPGRVISVVTVASMTPGGQGDRAVRF